MFKQISGNFIFTQLYILSLWLLLNVYCTCSPDHSHSTGKGQFVRQRMLQAAASARGSKASSMMESGFMTAPQCRCKDVKDCNQELADVTNKCRTNPKCESFLKKIGESSKIRACLAREQADMERLEDCVEKKVDPIGCTNDEHPKNLTIQVMSMSNMDSADCGRSSKRPKRATANSRQQTDKKKNREDLTHAPMELSDYLMCVDECAMNALNDQTRMCTSRSSQLNCAIKLRCTLAPPDEKGQNAFTKCEKETGLLPQKRFKTSCNCLKNAGINIQCPK